MFSFSIALLLSCPLLMLRLSDPAGSFPKPLSEHDEKRCIELMAQGDENARNRLIEHNLRLVAHIIKKYYTQASDQDDLISIGTIGLIKGITTYRPDKNVRLATYASRCVENEILMHFRSQRKISGELSLSESLDSSDDDGSLSLIDVISVPDNMLENISASETTERLLVYIRTVLDPREEKIISLRYGLGGKKPLTQKEVAQKLGISRSYVSRIEKRALEKLREKFERDEV